MAANPTSSITVSTTFNNTSTTGSLGISSGTPKSDYNAKGAMEYIVVTMLVYSLLGILSLLLVRIVRRAKIRLNNGHDQLRIEELNSIRGYLREQPQLQVQGRRQKLMHQKTKTAITLWRTKIPSLSQPLLYPTTPLPHHSHTVYTEYTPHHTEVLLYHHHRHHSNSSHKQESEEEEAYQRQQGIHQVQINQQQQMEVILETESNGKEEESTDTCLDQFSNQPEKRRSEEKSHQSRPDTNHDVHISDMEQTQSNIDHQ